MEEDLIVIIYFDFIKFVLYGKFVLGCYFLYLYIWCCVLNFLVCKDLYEFFCVVEGEFEIEI